jgi:hypothetical protein
MECPRTQLGAANLVDHLLPDVPIRQFVVTMPFPLRFPLAFDGNLLGHRLSAGLVVQAIYEYENIPTILLLVEVAD